MGDTASRIRVLHVEDEPNFADLAATFLEREDDRLSVVTAHDIEQGLETLASVAVDCIVSDYDLPRQNGIDFLETVREDHPELPFILFTGKGSEAVASDAISAGVTDYLQKEAGTDQFSILANRIRNTVEGHRARQAVETSEKRLRRVYDRITDGFFAVDTDWEYTYVNDEGARLVGHAKADLVGTEVWEAFPEMVDTPFEDALRTAMNRQETTTVEEFYPPHDRWYDVTVYSDGQGISIYFRNVTERKRHEQTLEQERQRRSALFEDLGEPCVEVTFDGDDAIVQDVNDAFEHVFGVDQSAFVGQALNSQIVPDDERAAARELNRRVRDGMRVEREVQRQTADGPRWFILRTVPFTIDGETGAYAIYLDITEEKKVRQELETTVDNLPGYVYRHYRETGWPLEFVKGSAEPITGYSVGELETEVSLAEEIIHPADREAVREGVEQGLTDDGRYDLTYRIRTKTGETRWIRDQGQSIEDPATGAEYLDGFVTDVTERKVQERRLDTLIDNLPGIVYRSRNEPEWPMEFVRGECEAITGYAADELESEAVVWAEDVLHPEDRDRIWQTVQEQLADSDSFEVRYRIRTPGGETRWLWERGRAVESRDGDTSVLEGFISDITAQTERERSLERKTERLDEFARVVSHDLRNPLNVATTRLELLGDECESEHIEYVERAHDRMEGLIDGLLTLARTDASSPDAEPVDLGAVAERCWANVETGRADLTVETDRTIVADEGRLAQVFENLIRNAVEHGVSRNESGDVGAVGADEPTVTVTVGDLDGGFYVEDDGSGIPKAQREDIFDVGHSTADGGTGFGLSIVSDVVTGHGWDVRVVDGTDGGARFEITGVE